MTRAIKESHGGDTVEPQGSLALHVDELFIAQLENVLTPDQHEMIGQYVGLEIETEPGRTSTPDDFTRALHQRLQRDHRIACIATSTDAHTEIIDANGESTSLIDLGLSILVKDIEDSIDTIKEHAPLEKAARKPSVMRKALRFLRPDLWEDAQTRHAQDTADQELRESYEKSIRDRNFNKLLSVLDDLSNNAGLTLVGCIPKAVLIQLAQTTPGNQHSSTDIKPSLPSRQERLSGYEKPTGDEEEALVNGGGSVQDDHKSVDKTRQSETLIESQGVQQFEFSWLSPHPVELDVVRYTQLIQVDRVRALSPQLDRVADGVDRNPINSHGHDKYEAIVDHLARRIASGVMPWDSANSVKREKTKSRNPDRNYPETIWYTFDRSPNAPRVYFTIGAEEIVAEDSRPRRQLIILAETDKAHQIEVLSELTGLGVKTLRAHGAGAQ